jgi:hypothetical protein
MFGQRGGRGNLRWRRREGAICFRNLADREPYLFDGVSRGAQSCRDLFGEEGKFLCPDRRADADSEHSALERHGSCVSCDARSHQRDPSLGIDGADVGPTRGRGTRSGQERSQQFRGLCRAARLPRASSAFGAAAWGPIVVHGGGPAVSILRVAMPGAHTAVDASAEAEGRWTRPLAWTLAVVAIALTLGQVSYYFTRTVDDLFISLRYAENLAHGDGLVFNLGERVEGFSSPLWVVLQALLVRLGLDGVTATKLLGVLSLLALWATCYAYVRVVGHGSRTIAWGTLALLAANSYLTSWAVLGLETPLYLALLVGWPLSLHLLLHHPSRRRQAIAGAVGVLLGCTRPEAGLYLAASSLAVVGLAMGPRSLHSRNRLRSLAPALLAVLLVLIAFEFGRYLYFDSWVPHTFHAKRGHGLDVARLLPWVGQGAHSAEVAFLLLGLASAAWQGARTGHWTLLANLFANAVFLSAVAEDWMPNQRYHLPTWVFSTLAVGTSASVLLRAPPRWRAAAWSMPVIGLWCAGHQALVDSRFSAREFQTHGGGERWLRKKTGRRWQDAWLALRRVTPPHIRQMSVSNMGMIQQLFLVLEASAAPEADSWYVGRDIGRVGYFSPVRVFDTDGLFTPEVFATAAATERKRLYTELARAAFAKRPVAAEVYGDWRRGAGRLVEELAHYDVLLGSRRLPITLRRRCKRPTASEILRRYARVANKLPRFFHLSTLYGEGVGAAIEKRHTYVKRHLQSRRGFEVAAVPPGLTGGGLLFQGLGIQLHGCRFSHPAVQPGETVRMDCYFEATQTISREYQVFVHLLDERGRRRLNADHPPCAGFHPMRDWKPGRVVEDSVEFTVPVGFEPTTLTAHLGLYSGVKRAVPWPPETADHEDRVLGPSLRVRASHPGGS